MQSTNSDGTRNLRFVYDDGGRAEAGFKGKADDCVCRAIAIATGHPYAAVYASLSAGAGSERNSRGASARNGIRTSRQWFRNYMATLGFKWVPTMRFGQGCKVHLLEGQLPNGILIVSISRHYTAVIDGEIRDIFDPSRSTVVTENGSTRLAHRCVYGFWKKVSS